MKSQIELHRLIEYNEHGVESYEDLPPGIDGLEVYWIASLSSMSYYNGSRRLPILTAPSQPIESGKHWFIYGRSDSVFGGFNDNDKDAYDVTIDLTTGEVYYNT